MGCGCLTAIVVGLVVAPMLIMGQCTASVFESSMKRSDRRQREQERYVDAPVISAARLGREYREDEMKADAAYRKRRLVITGKVIEADVPVRPCLRHA